MEAIKELSAIELQRKGIEVLVKDLGMAGAMQFLKLYDKGAGDWTKERQTILNDLTVDDVMNEIIATRKI